MSDTIKKALLVSRVAVVELDKAAIAEALNEWFAQAGAEHYEDMVVDGDSDRANKYHLYYSAMTASWELVLDLLAKRKTLPPELAKLDTKKNEYFESPTDKEARKAWNKEHGPKYWSEETGFEVTVPRFAEAKEAAGPPVIWYGRYVASSALSAADVFNYLASELFSGGDPIRANIFEKEKETTVDDLAVYFETMMVNLPCQEVVIEFQAKDGWKTGTLVDLLVDRTEMWSEENER